jgi:uncharacterized protein YrrD
MRIRESSHVYTADNKSVGKIDRVVIDPRTKEITHLVIRKGLLLPEDKVIPISLVASANDDRVQLREDAGDLDQFPAFEEINYVPLHNFDALQADYQEGYARPLYWYPSADLATLGRTGMLGIPVTGYPAEYAAETRQNIPPDSIALEAGAKVISADGKHAGDLDAVLSDPSINRVTHFILKEGFLSKEKKLIPVDWISRVDENEIHLTVGSQTIEHLRKYKG